MPTKADGLVPPPTTWSQQTKLSNESVQGQGAARETLAAESSPEKGE